MYVLIFTRLTGSDEEAIFLDGTFDTHEKAELAMLLRVAEKIENQDFEGPWCYVESDQAFLGSSDMYDTCRYYIFDTENPVGFFNDRQTDWLSLTGRLD